MRAVDDIQPGVGSPLPHDSSILRSSPIPASDPDTVSLSQQSTKRERKRERESALGIMRGPPKVEFRPDELSEIIGLHEDQYRLLRREAGALEWRVDGADAARAHEVVLEFVEILYRSLEKLEEAARELRQEFLD